MAASKQKGIKSGMESNEGQREIRAREQRRQFQRICGELLVFQADALGQYYPGPTFWDFAFPGRPDAVRPYRFDEGYAGLIPNAYADRIDDVLVKWVTRKLSGSEAARQIGIIGDEVRRYRDKEVESVGDRTPTEEEQVLAVVSGHLVESLARLRDEILVDERRQADAAVMIQRFRDVLLPGFSNRGDQLLGRG